MSVKIRRHFISVGGRKVHYRRAGDGPALILLHASPVSSRVFEKAMRLFGQHYTCFAFDTPSNGLSDPLPIDDPDMADFADAQADTLRALGIESCIAYGRHTGASIGVELARRHPDLVTMVMTDGYPVFSPEQREAYLSGYLSDLPLEPDGSHLVWIWNRYRDQFVFWPWNKKVAEFRADVDMPEVGFLQDGVIALMEAGNGYKEPYRAVFKHDALDALAEVKTPVCVASRPGDSLFRKLGDFTDEHWVETISREFRSACRRELELMEDHAPSVIAPYVKQDTEGGTYIETNQEQLFAWRHHDPKDSRPIIVLGEVPGSVMWLEEALKDLARHRSVIAIDPAGCGESDPPYDQDVSLERQADRIVSALKRLEIQDCEIVTYGSSAGIGLELALSLGAACRALTWIDAPVVDDTTRAALAAAAETDLSTEMDGTHLIKLWARERDAMIWFPWFERTRAAARPTESLNLDEASHQKSVETLNKHVDYYAAHARAVWSYALNGAALTELANSPITLRQVRTSLSLVPQSKLEAISDLPDPITVDTVQAAFQAVLDEKET